MEANWFPYTQEKYRLFGRLTTAWYSPGRLVPLVKGAYRGLRLESCVAKLARKGRRG